MCYYSAFFQSHGRETPLALADENRGTGWTGLRALSLCSEVNLSATSPFENVSEDQRDSRYQRSSLFVIRHTGQCQVAGWEFLRGILETGTKFVLQDGLSFW